MSTKRTALVTGASSGIGRAFAVYYAERGYDLVITGRRIEKLRALAAEMEEKFGTSTDIIEAEFSEIKDVQKVVRVIQNRHDIYTLINNAGFGSGVEFCKSDLAKHLSMLNVHVEASIRLIYAVLPQMMSRKEGVILNISSIGAYLPGPGSVMYTGTKLFLAGFSESLHTEIHKYGIKIKCICPGLTHSDFHDRRAAGKGLKTGKLMWMEPETVVKLSIDSLDKQRVVVVPGTINKLMVSAVFLFPKKLYYYFAERSGNVKPATGLFDRMKHLVEKTVPFFFTTHTNQV